MAANNSPITIHVLIIVVTGATEGVGRAFAEELARRGLNIALLDSDLDLLNEVSAEIGKFHRFF